MSWASELPEELLCRSSGLVVLTGLDTTYNATHKLIWDSFCNNRKPDRVPLRFVVLDADHEYPKSKQKRSSYEWHVPKGILKTNWMKKHLYDIPSVVVMFFDLDWDENLWKERQMECATRLEIVRNSLQGRGVRVSVVLIQKNAPLPPGEDVIAAERAASFCSACDLSAKSLFVLPHTDHLLGYTIRLENAFYELAQSYYHAQARKVKAHKEFLNKTTHQFLFVRHQFKVAFLNEVKQDTHTAIKHYKQAYGHILELRMHDSNLLEIKTVSGFINYKICRLSFQHNAPLDAIAQFRKHIDFFKKRVGAAELAFEHSAYMAKQFHVFGDLFDEAIRLGLTAIQTQHPGFYYQQAANHATARKQLCRGLCHPSSAPPASNVLDNLNSLDFYGQRPWRQGHQSIDPPDPIKEKEGIHALQSLELKEDHSWLIIPLLSSAVAQFKKYKSPRMKRNLMVQMGEEYYHAKDYNKALMLLSRVTWEYRCERWWPLLTSILITSLRCAYLIGNIQEYVTLCLELTGKYPPLPLEEKTRIQMNLIRVMSNNPPEPEIGCDADCIEKAKPLWRVETSEPCTFTVELQQIVPFVECKTRFIADSFTADTPVTLQLFLRTSCPFPIRFSKLSVHFNNQTYNQHCVVHDGQDISSSVAESIPGDLYLIPGHHNVHTFHFLPLKEDIGGSIEISHICLELGSSTARCAILKWNGGGGDALSNMTTGGTLPKKKAAAANTQTTSLSWDEIGVLSSARLEPRVSMVNLSLTHMSPSLVNEFYPIQINIENGEESQVADVCLSVGLKEGQDTFLEQNTHISLETAEFDSKVRPRMMGVQLENLQPGVKCSKWAYVKNLHTGDRVIFVKVSYDVKVTVNQSDIVCQCHQEEQFTLSAVHPLSVGTRLTSMKYEKIDTVHAEEPFLLNLDLESISPWAVDIKGSSLALSAYVKNMDEVFESQLNGVILEKTEQASECICLEAHQAIQQLVAMGTYHINWRRKDDKDLPYVSTTITLPTITVEHVPLYVDLDMPAFATVRSSFPVTYNIYNRTGFVQEMEVTMDSNEAFMYAGHRQLHFRVLPNGKYKLQYNMYPLVPGNVPLPKLHLNMLRYPGTVDQVVQTMLPTHAFVKPAGKRMISSK